jgi:opacity protein-like surface antigen
MRRKFLLGTGLLAFAAASGGSAIAADIAARPVGAPPPPMAAPAFISDWTGFYVGINGGGGWAHTDYQIGNFFSSTALSPFEFPESVPPNQSSSGGIFGFQFGHNWQWGPAVGGLEIDFDGASINGNSTFFSPATAFSVPGTFTNQVKIDELASARGRLGWLIFPNFLLYGTAGLGWGHIRETATATTAAPFLPSFLSSTSDTSQFGWVAGAGLEYKFAVNWLIRGEWLHYDFGRQDNNSGTFNSLQIFSTGTSVDFGNSRTTVDIARAALSYKFPPP